MSNLNGICFFLKNQVRAWLAAKEDGVEAAFRFVNGDRFVLEMIDRPYRCSFSADDGMVTAKLYIRNELGLYDEDSGDLNLTVFADGRQSQVWDSNRIIGGEEMAQIFLRAANRLRKMISDMHETELFCGEISPVEGFIVKRAGEVPNFRRVAGEKRPSMICTTLFDGEQIVRPYPEEAGSLRQRAEKPLSVLRQEAEAGDEEAMERLAFLGLTENIQQAAFWFGKLAEADDAVGQYQLGLLYLRGAGVEKSVEKALHMMKCAEANDYAQAAFYVKTCDAVLRLQPLADGGDCSAMACLAEQYLELGSSMEGGEAYLERSLQLAEQAEKEQIPTAMWVLARCYECGYGTAEDVARAVAYYEKGSALGHAGCQHKLGCFCLQGMYLFPDWERGMELCTKSAMQGYGPAMLTLGKCYRFGEGVPADMNTALEWYEKYLEEHDDPEIAQLVLYRKTLSELMGDAYLSAPVGMPYQEGSFGGGSAFGEDPFGVAAMGSEMDFGGDLFGMQQGMFFDVSACEGAVPMIHDELLWTRLRAEDGDESAIALLTALGEPFGTEP